MKQPWSSFYILALALWVGGMAIYTFVMTPAVFRSFNRDMAGQIVGTLFPGYFEYTLTLSALAFILLIVTAPLRTNQLSRISFILAVLALVINAFITFKLYPKILDVKKQISSFESESPESEPKKKFSELHGVSAALNLIVLADGITLLMLAPFFKR